MARERFQESKAAPLGRRERNKREKLGRIVAAASRLFRAKGFEATTTQAIADQAGIAAGTLFLYARTKEELLLLVFQDEMEQVVQAAFDSLPGRGRLVDRLMHVFDAFVRYHAGDVPLARAVIRELAFHGRRDRRRDVLGTFHKIRAGLVQLVEEARARAEVDRAIDARLAAVVLFSIFYLLLQGWLNDDMSRRKFSEVLRQRLQFAIEGMAPRAGRLRAARGAAGISARA